ncbi:UDP-N-acetylmuramoyl-L-alanine--D-glutamate ligase [Porphyromonas levii]|uniref:UDP-N-acetylmuramoyl-L-alanine--D-glutamate ligase n=1 Tax=Porphyromonas levii TaxID=28114 RepID=UPI001FCFC089|nr:UDP-N-acetylmuramoyl-L-alanine--D-glutamate ligase [Porphyromonas levii]MBR8702454.1 UDP-N-acetylmuramoylalanine--D-glutamate ligase [Porphyromonas levii]
MSKEYFINRTNPEAPMDERGEQIPLVEIIGKEIVILGGGESGVSAALLAKKEGLVPFLSDNGPLKSEMRALLQSEHIPYEEGGHILSNLNRASEVIKSPGIPDTAPVIVQCESMGLPIISEIEFAARYLRPEQFIGITGSNGKTTTTTLVDMGLRAAGVHSSACGNIGVSLARKVLDGDADTFAMELSSFQLDSMYDTHLHIAMLLNLSPDHLDRYDHKYENYALAKWRIFRNQGAGDYAILNVDDQFLSKLRIEHPLTAEHMLTFSCKDPKATAYFDGKTIHLPGEVTYDFSSFRLRGEHNAQNVMAAALALYAYGIAPDHPEVVEAFSTFGGVRHRTQIVGEWHGVTFVNDSKGTNLDATAHALSAMPDGRTILFLGGTDKGNDYSEIYDLVKAKAKALIFLTLDTDKLHKSFDILQLPTSTAHSMAEAFQQIQALDLHEGDVVLLSPACASFDLFNNYEDRGDQFVSAFQQLV